MELWGSGDQLGPLAMALRAIAVFFLLLALVRIGGARVFGKMSAFDNVVVIVLGAVAARAIVGASPFASVATACAVIVGLHWICAKLAVGHRFVRRVAEGRPVLLYRNGQLDRAALRRTALSEEELLATLRLETHHDRLDAIDRAWLEANGKISFVERPHGGARRPRRRPPRRAEGAPRSR